MKDTILVVEDEYDIRELLKEFLTEVGYDVVTAEDGLEALEKDKQNDSLNFTKEDFLLSYNHAIDELNSEELLKYLASDIKLDIPEKLLDSTFKSINLRLKNNKEYTLFLFFGLQPISDASKAILMLFPICFMMILFISFISAFIYSKILLWSR